MEKRQTSALITALIEQRPALLRFLVARFRDEAVAEDILQEMFLKLERSSIKQPIENIPAFLYRTANNLALDFKKQAMRQQTRDKNWTDSTTQQISGEPVDDTVDITRVLDAKKKVARITKALQQLSPQCKRVFTAHKLEGLTHSEVAAQLNISRSTVEKHMSKALKHLILNLKDMD